MGIFAKRRRWLNEIKENRADIQTRIRTGNEGEIVVFSDRILKRQGALGEMYSLDGVSASITHVGAQSARGTLTRAMTVGGGWQRKMDDRQMFLVIEGPEFSWLVDITPPTELLRATIVKGAHTFVTQVNLAVRQHELTASGTWA